MCCSEWGESQWQQRRQSEHRRCAGQGPLFAALDRESAAALRTSITEVQLSKGQTLFHENETGDRLYVVLEGKIKLSRTSPDGRKTC